MNRAGFVGGALALAVIPRAARANAPDISAEIARIPGITGVYAATLGSATPIVSVRAGEPFATASVIKLAIMVAAFQSYEAGLHAPDELIELRAADLIGGSPLLASARPGERYRMDTLVRAMIAQSDNSASNALITTLSFATINASIARAGLHGTHLGRHFASVVPAWRISENVSTPRDIGTLLLAIERGAHEGMNTVAKTASCRAMIDILLQQEDDTKIRSGLPRGTPCANKTGEIDFVRNDAAIVDPYGEAPYVLVVMTRALRDTSAGNRGIAAIARHVDRTLR